MNKEHKKAPKTWQKPELKSYGSVEELTQGSMDMNDPMMIGSAQMTITW